jgi:hypothetical protein
MDLKHINKDFKVSSSGKFFYKGIERIPYIHKIKCRSGNLSLSMYVYICTFNKKGKHLHAAKTVAMLFIDNPNEYRYIMYKDGNFKNINANNLEWIKRPPTMKRPLIKNTIKLDQTNLSDPIIKAIQMNDSKGLFKEIRPFYNSRVYYPFFKSCLFDLVNDIHIRGKGLQKGMNDKMLTKYINKTIKFRFLDYSKRVGKSLNYFTLTEL